MARELEEGKCPRCGSESITYSELIPIGEVILYPATCDDCGCDFSEYYDLVFSTQLINE